MRLHQTEGEYEHIQRALAEGASPETVVQLVASRWRIFLECGLGFEIDKEIQIIRNLCPAIAGEMEKFNS